MFQDELLRTGLFSKFYMRDAFVLSDGFTLINIGTGNGTHWTFSRFYPNLGLWFYFDSFALRPPQNIEDAVKKIPYKYFNMTKVQKITEINCGELVIKYARKLEKIENSLKLKSLKKSDNVRTDEIRRNIIQKFDDALKR